MNGSEFEIANVTMTNNSNGTTASVSSDPSSSLFFIWSSVTMAGIGLIANGFVLLILTNKELRRRLANILITIQVGSDFITCFFIIVCNAYSLGIGGWPLSDDTVGYFVCMFIVGKWKWVYDLLHELDRWKSLYDCYWAIGTWKYVIN